MRILGFLLLFGLWLLLSSTDNVAHVATGAIAAWVVMLLNPAGPPHVRKLSWFAMLNYLPWIIGRILKSGFHVSRLILSPSLPISPRIIRHETKLTSDGELVVLGNSITLTPGTITVEVEPGELVVHAIDEASSTDLVSGALEAKIGRIFVPKDGAP
jgi:multicomponent Na+:H+ antiporter subunit E